MQVPRDSVRGMRYSMILLFIGWMTAGCAQQPATVWKFEKPDRIAEHAATTSGSPGIVKEKDGRSICFKGEPDALQLDHNPIAGWSGFTIEALIKPSTAGTAATCRTIFR
jgi:hypothetical protein